MSPLKPLPKSLKYVLCFDAKTLQDTPLTGVLLCCFLPERDACGLETRGKAEL